MEKINYWEDEAAKSYYGLHDDEPEDEDYINEGEA